MATYGKTELSQRTPDKVSDNGAQRKGSKSKSQVAADAQTMFTTAKPPSQTTDVAISDASGSEEEDSAVLMRMDSDISLPRAPVKQLIMDKLPKTARIHQHAKELISNLCMHFLMKLAEESNEFCSAQNKKTVCPDHVLDALTKMNLGRYFPKLAAQEDQKPQTVSVQKKGTKAASKSATAKAIASKSDAAENNTEAQNLRAAILTRLAQSMEGAGKMRGGSKGRGDKDDRVDDGLTDEQLNLAQEKLFREAREQYDQQQMAAAEQAQQKFANGQESDVPMMFDQGQIDASMEEPQPYFNPTDFFREIIFTTDFNQVPTPAMILTGEPSINQMDFVQSSDFFRLDNESENVFAFATEELAEFESLNVAPTAQNPNVGAPQQEWYSNEEEIQNLKQKEQNNQEMEESKQA